MSERRLLHRTRTTERSVAAGADTGSLFLSAAQVCVYFGGNVWVAGGVGCGGEMGYPARAISPAGPRFIAWVGGNAERVVSESGGPRHVRRG